MGLEAPLRRLRCVRDRLGAAWYRSYRDRPSEHPDVDQEELAWIEQDSITPDSQLPTPTHNNAVAEPADEPESLRHLRDGFAFGYGLYFYFTWLPTYLIRELRFSLLAGGFFSSLPFLLAGAANITGGWCTDALARTRGLRVARVMLGFSAFSLCAVLILGSILAFPRRSPATMLALALASADFALSACWAVCLDVAPSHAGVVTGFMNTFGNLGGPHWTAGRRSDRRSAGIGRAAYVTAGVYFAGAVAWLAINPNRRIAQKRNRTPTPV